MRSRLSAAGPPHAQQQRHAAQALCPAGRQGYWSAYGSGRQEACRQQRQLLYRPAAAPSDPPPMRVETPIQLCSMDKHDYDPEKEKSRVFRRVTFDHELWAKHRSTSRYWRHISSMTRSRVVKALAVPMTYVGTVATMVCCYEDFLAKQLLPDWGFDWPGLAVSTSGVYSLSTFALSLLLVFRTNSSYQRWNDARKLWGLTTNRCRDLARQVLQWMPDPSDAELAAGSCRMIRAFPIALMAALRNDHSLERDLALVLHPLELQLILEQPHTTTAILQALGALVAASHMKEVQKLRIDENITVLQETMGGCERIFKTPIPLIYSRHTSRFLLCWLTILPFCTAGQVGWVTVPIACAMAFFLLGIEEIGVQVEEPFGILALEAFCENISKNVQQAQSAAAAMQAVAHAHATYPQAMVQAAREGNAATGNSRSNGGSSSTNTPLPLMPALQQPVAGQRVAAAENAHSAPVALPPGIKGPVSLDSSNSSNGSNSSLRDQVVLSSWAAAAVSGHLSGGSAGSLGGSREYELSAAVASDDEGDASYWPSAVSSGAIAGDSEDF